LVQKSIDCARIKNFSRAVQAKKHKKTRLFIPSGERPGSCGYNGKDTAALACINTAA